MSVIAIVGAGGGMGRSIATLFGRKGFRVALLSRQPAHLDAVVSELTAAGIEAAAFAADVMDRASVASGLAAVTARFGAVDVLEYSPSGGVAPMAGPAEVTYENLQPWLEFQLHGAVAAVNAVLPAMLERGSGTILFTTGASAVYPSPMFGNIGPAGAALRNWAHALHHGVGPKGVQVGHVSIGAFLGRQPGATTDAVAPLYWHLHTQRDQFERIFLPEAQAWLPGSVAQPMPEPVD